MSIALRCGGIAKALRCDGIAKALSIKPPTALINMMHFSTISSVRTSILKLPTTVHSPSQLDLIRIMSDLATFEAMNRNARRPNKVLASTIKNAAIFESEFFQMLPLHYFSTLTNFFCI
jgi:hypothetical protein